MDDLNSTGTYLEYCSTCTIEFRAFPHRCFRRREIVFAPLSGLTIFLRSIDRQTDVLRLCFRAADPQTNPRKRTPGSPEVRKDRAPSPFFLPSSFSRSVGRRRLKKIRPFRSTLRPPDRPKLPSLLVVFSGYWRVEMVGGRPGHLVF